MLKWDFLTGSSYCPSNIVKARKAKLDIQRHH